MSPKPRTSKPGAERAPFRPDNIITIHPAAENKLLPFLVDELTDKKRTAVKALLKYGQVMVNNVVTSQWDRSVDKGDVVKVNTSRPFQTFSNPRLHIVYEDDHIIVVNKGYGLLSVGTDTKNEGTAYWLLRDYVKRVDPRNKIFIVHRLDRDTSGLMVFAKSVEAKEALQHNWNNMVLERTYVAVVVGTPEPPEGQIRSFLAENAAHEVYSVDDPTLGKEALTRYRVVKSRGKYSMVELNLETGRKNQIRVHLHDIGHPISGDRRYGGDSSPIHRLALHAKTLRFIHPITRRDMNFSSALPQGFGRLV